MQELSKIAFSAVAGIGLSHLILTPLEANLDFCKGKNLGQIMEGYA